MNERDFKGIWIPKEIWLDDRLSALDKVILAEIDSLDNGDRGCYASNKHLSEFCQCSERRVSDAVSKLIEFGYVELTGFDGRQRTLRSRLEKSARQTRVNCESETQKLLQSNIYREPLRRIDKRENTKRDAEIIAEFEEIWKRYPKKQGKENAQKAYLKARKDGVDKESIERGLEAYIAFLRAEKTDPKYIKHGSTWFNQRCWEDDYSSGRKVTTRDLASKMDFSDFMEG